MGLLDDDKKPAHRERSDRPSWSEIDRRKEKGSTGSSGKGPKPGTKAAYLEERASKQALSAADALFANPAESIAQGEILKAVGQADLVAAVDAYRSTYDRLPAVPEVCIQALQHPEEAVQLEALEVLAEVVPELTGTTRQVTLKGIGIFQMSARNMTARKAAKRIVKRNAP